MFQPLMVELLTLMNLDLSQNKVKVLGIEQRLSTLQLELFLLMKTQI
jgi:hypothetical protein